MNTSVISSYEQQAIDFLNTTNTSFKAVYKAFDYHFAGDDSKRHTYRITLRNDLGSYTFSFGKSISDVNKTPTPYDVLACLQKYDVGSYEDFCSEFGYDQYSQYGTGKNKVAYSTYKAVVKEFAAIERLFTAEQIEALQDIQ